MESKTFWCIYPPTQLTQDVNWTYTIHSEDVLDVFWTSYVRPIYVLCLLGILWTSYLFSRQIIAVWADIPSFKFNKKIKLKNVFKKFLDTSWKFMMITFKGLLEYLFLQTFFNSCFSSLSKTYSITTRQKCDNSMCLL